MYKLKQIVCQGVTKRVTEKQKQLRQDELKVAEDELSSIDKNSPFAKPLNLRGDDPARVFFVAGTSAEIYTTPSVIMDHIQSHQVLQGKFLEKS